MRASETALSLIKKWEGSRLQAYRDQAGILTIGYGITGPWITPHTTITQGQAEKLLQERVNVAASAVNKAIPAPLSQNQFDALVSLAYNVGQAAFRGSTLVRLVNERRYAEAADQFLRWDHAAGRVDEGLLKRREAERALFLA
jgi:lysozyme